MSPAASGRSSTGESEAENGRKVTGTIGIILFFNFESLSVYAPKIFQENLCFYPHHIHLQNDCKAENFEASDCNWGISAGKELYDCAVKSSMHSSIKKCNLL